VSDRPDPSKPRIAFIGGGNMAQSLLSGLLASGYPAAQLCATDPAEPQRAAITALGVTALTDNALAVRDADVVVLAVKPQVMRAVTTALFPKQTDGALPLLISIAAGVPLASIARWTGAGAIVRAMPNTPALLQAGITGVYASAGVSDAGRALAERILGAAGKVVWVDQETDLDAVTAVSGSGPAYFFHLMEAMIEAGEALGLTPETALELTLETAYGAALMARRRDATPTRLRQNVTSPGGTTERALALLDAAGVSAAVRAAVTGAAIRARELAEELGRS
jgi:pyrroline-5-carboxylate reductase